MHQRNFIQRSMVSLRSWHRINLQVNWKGLQARSDLLIYVVRLNNEILYEGTSQERALYEVRKQADLGRHAKLDWYYV